MGNPLLPLLELSPQEKIARGLEHTPREIWQQPRTWRATYELCRELLPELQAALHRAGIGSAGDLPTVYLVGAGTSDFIGRALASLLRQRWHCDVWTIPSTTLLTDFDELHRRAKNYLWISFSRSGDSPEGVALLARSLDERGLDPRPQIRHIVVTCNRKGEMAELCSRHSDRAFALILDDSVNDRGLAMTSSFTNMVVAGQCLANFEALPQYGNLLAQMADAGSSFLSLAAEVAADISALGCSRACFVASGALRAAADESALKLMELSAGRVVTMAESPLGLRHGPMASLDGQTLLVAFLSSDARRRGYELDLLGEISRKRLGRIRAVVTANGTEDVSSLADYFLPLNCPPNFPDAYRPVLDVMLGQLLGLFASLRHGLKPDRPSPSGAIARVVPPIRFY